MLHPPSVCASPPTPPPHHSEIRRQRGQRAHTQDVLEGCMLMVLGKTRSQVRAPVGQCYPLDPRWGWEYSGRKRMGIVPPVNPETGLGALT